MVGAEREVHMMHSLHALLYTTIQNNISLLYAQHEQSAQVSTIAHTLPFLSALPSHHMNQAVMNGAKIDTMEGRHQENSWGQ
jgi:hypothetical protein